MSTTFALIKKLVAAGKFRVSVHGFENLEDRDISLERLVYGLVDAAVIEDYPEYHKGPSVLVRQDHQPNGFVHALWGVSKASPDEAVLITAYRPEPDRWSKDFLHRLRDE